MIVLISAQQPDPESPVDDRFGRCAFLVAYDTEAQKWETFANPGASKSGGAGVAAAQFVIDQKANTVISGDFGPHASAALSAAGISMVKFKDRQASAQQVADDFMAGKLGPIAGN